MPGTEVGGRGSLVISGEGGDGMVQGTQWVLLS